MGKADQEEKEFRERWWRGEEENSRKTLEERVHQFEKDGRWIERIGAQIWRTTDHILIIVMLLAVVVAILCASVFLKLF